MRRLRSFHEREQVSNRVCPAFGIGARSCVRRSIDEITCSGAWLVARSRDSAASCSHVSSAGPRAEVDADPRSRR